MTKKDGDLHTETIVVNRVLTRAMIFLAIHETLLDGHVRSREEYQDLKRAVVDFLAFHKSQAADGLTQ